jgi:hypothetical protein
MSEHYAIHCFRIRDKYELDCDIQYGFTPGDPGVRYYPDGSGCPPTPPEIEILKVTVKSVDFWMWVVEEGVPCLVYPCLDRDWLEDRGWATMVDEIARRILDDMAFDCESALYCKLVDEAEYRDE